MTPRPGERPDLPNRQPAPPGGHPRVAAVVLMVGVVLLLIAIGLFGSVIR